MRKLIGFDKLTVILNLNNFNKKFEKKCPLKNLNQKLFIFLFKIIPNFAQSNNFIMISATPSHYPQSYPPFNQYHIALLVRLSIELLSLICDIKINVMSAESQCV